MLTLADWTKAGVAPIALLWVFHFARRTLESLWVHRYSGRPVPPSDYLVEYLYYWGFGTWIALGISSSDWHPTSPLLSTCGLVVFFAGELGNAWCHLKLRSLRSSSGVEEKSIPEGGPFELVSCPHYTFEVMSWLGFAVYSWTLGSLAFSIVGAGILVSYAMARHTNYKKTYDGKDGRPLYPPSRKALIPFVF